MPSLGQLGGALTGGGVIGGAVVRLVLDDTQFSGNLSKAESQFKASTASMSKTGTTAATGVGGAFARMSGAGQIAVIALAAAVVKFGADSVRAFAEAQQVAAQTAAVLKSTGGAANVTASQVAGLADSIRNYSGIDDEAVQASENLLLTFRAVQNQAGAGNDIFNQATQAIADMATALNGGAVPSMEDLHSATLQLGKALNDPVVGLTALRRVGVSFTASQADLIKSLAESGHLLQAQKMILSEVEKEFGGAAKAAGGTFAGAIAKLSSNFHDLEEAVGQGISPLIGAFAKGLIALLPVLVPVARNLYLIVGAAAGFAAVRFLPELLLGIATGMEAIGAASVANGIAGVAAALAALTAPEIIGGLAVAYAGFKAFQRISGQTSIFNPTTTGQIASQITEMGRAIGALPGPLEAVKASMAGSNQVFQRARPLLDQMGTSMRDFVTAANAAASKGQSAFQQFADSTLVKSADAIQKWRQATADSLNFVDDALANFAGKSHVAASQIISAFQKASSEQKQFGSDISTILKRGGTDAKGLAQQLIGMGQDGVAAAHAIAGANKKAFDQIVSGYARGASAADKLAGSLQGKLIGTLKNIEAILQAIARKWGVNIDVNDSQAVHAAGAVKTALDHVPTKVTSSIIVAANQAMGAISSVLGMLNSVDGYVAHAVISVSRQVTGAARGMGPSTGAIVGAANGGITRASTYMQVGEGRYSTFAGRGSEAVIPLNDRGISVIAHAMQKAGAGRGITVNIHTNGGGKPEDIAQAVSRHLSRVMLQEALV